MGYGLARLIMLNTNLPPEQLSLVNRCFHPGGSYVEFEKEEVEQSISDRFESQVRNHPHRLVIKTRTEELTYDELNRAANRVAHSILEKSGDGQDQVALLFEQSSAAIVAILGALKAGKTYVPLDRWLPADRLKYILDNSVAKLILTNDRNLPLAGELIQDKSRLINLDHCGTDLLAGDPKLPISPDSPAMITYTSGSTGEPKGVVHSHRNILHLAMNAANYFHLSPEDRLINLSTYSLHGGSRIIFPTLCTGASLFPLDLKEEGLTCVSEWLAQQEITIYFSVASAFRQMARSMNHDEVLSTVRLVELGGERIDHRDVEIFNRHFPKDCIFVNRLASTEVDAYSMYFMGQESTIEGSLVPVGYPPYDKEILLLDEDGDEIGPNEAGEIAVRTPFVALGYWKLPELTQAVFKPDPDGGENRIFLTGDLGQRLPDGSLLHLGRKDFQVKIRGYRVEIAEIESRLVAHDEIANAIVLGQDNWREEKQLVAYLVGSGKSMPSDDDLRRFLGSRIPNYMIPSTFVRLESFPKLLSGKIDRSALSRPSQGRPELNTQFALPHSALEQTIADIWAQILEIDRVGRHDDFLDIGGDSLLAAALLVRLEEKFQKKLPLAALIEASTVAQMAKIFSHEGWSSSDSCLVPIQPNGSKLPFFCVHGIGGHVLGFAALARHLGKDQPFYGLESAGRDGEQRPLNRISAMAERYISEIRTVQPEGPYLLGGFSMGGVIAFEMAQQLRTQGHEVALLALIDSNCHGLTSAWKRRRNLLLHEIRNSPNLLQINPTTGRRIISEKAEVIAKSTITYSPVEKPNWQALRNYRPIPYPGKVTFFWASNRSEGPLDPRWGWKELATLGMEIHRVPGDHETMLREPQLQVLAERLNACLDQALPQ